MSGRKVSKWRLLSGKPTEEYDNSNGGETDYQKVDREEKKILEENNEYRIIEIVEYVSWGQGTSTIWGGGSYGGGTGGTEINTYRIKEWLE